MTQESENGELIPTESPKSEDRGVVVLWPVDKYGIQHGAFFPGKSSPCECDIFYINQFKDRMCYKCWPITRRRLIELEYTLYKIEQPSE